MREQLYHGTEEIAKRLNVSRNRVRAWIESESFPVFRDREGGTWMALESSICEFLKTLEKKYRIRASQKR